METAIEFLFEYSYLAMFGILFLCGLGLPIPEEVTLVGSGLLVGWGIADFWLASLTCIVGILAGDSVIFGLGYWVGPRFLDFRVMKIVNKEKVSGFFSKHGKKAVFFARFVAGVRIGVYAFAGTQRMNWGRFLFLDFLGALLSGPTSILVGMWVTKKFLSTGEYETEEEARDAALEKALAIVHEAGGWVLMGIIVLVLGFAIYKFGFGRKKNTAKEAVTEALHQDEPKPEE